MNTPSEDKLDRTSIPDELVQSGENGNQSRKIIEEYISAASIRSLRHFSGDLSLIEVNSIINKCRYINKFFEACNRALMDDGSINIRFETKDQRKHRILAENLWGLNWVLLLLDFVFHRAAPKVTLSKAMYFWLTHGKRRVLSKTEVLGRMICCGFDIESYETGNTCDTVVAVKKREPKYDPNPTYGPLISLKRLGKGGKLISVYKIRTMHPFSEYLQSYVMANNGLAEGGKFNEDFRITRWGRFLRKTWLDELPMILNWLNGDLKLVGVRPISSHYYSLYPEDLQNMRKHVKPGLLPPYYADLPSTLEEIIESERRYLLASKEHRIWTDVRYGARICWNIFFRGKRSQ